MATLEELPIRNPFPGAVSYRIASTESTQADAKRLAGGAGGAFPSGSVVAADEQTSGRGRFPERKWESEPGKNLLFTLYLEPAAARLPSGAPLPGLPLRIGGALCAAAERYAEKTGASFARPPRLKWPNDLMFGDRKAAGILCEAGSAGVFIGIGLNCNQLVFPPRLESGATSLAIELGGEVGRWNFLEILLAAISVSIADPDWRPRVETRLWRRGQLARFLPGTRGSASDSSGETRVLMGTPEGIDEDGSLIFREIGAKDAVVSAAGELRPGEIS